MQTAFFFVLSCHLFIGPGFVSRLQDKVQVYKVICGFDCLMRHVVLFLFGVLEGQCPMIMDFPECLQIYLNFVFKVVQS